MKRPGLLLTAASLAVGGVLLAAGCGSSSTTNTTAPTSNTTPIPSGQPNAPHNGGTLKAVLHGDIDYIDPALAYYQISWQVEYSTCVKLLNYPDSAGEAGKQLLPEAASAPPVVSPDGLTITFTVPPGKFKFNTGEPVTAKTFQFALERNIDPKQASIFAPSFINPYIAGASTYKGPAGKVHMSGVQVKGDQFILHLTKPNATIVTEMGTPFMCAIPLSTPVKPAGVTSIPGAGPYYIASWDQHRSLVLKKNPNYTGNRPQNVDEIDFGQMTIDQNPAVLELKSGTIDYCPDCAPGAQTFALNQQYGAGSPSAKAGDQRFFITPAAIVSYYALNTTRPTFSNVLVRQAFNYAINRPALLKPHGYGYGVVGDKLLPPTLPGSDFEPSIYPLNGPNLVKAKALMKQSGVTTPITAIEYTTAATPSVQQSNAVLQANLAKIGITLKPVYLTRSIQFQKEGVKGVAMDIADEGWVEDFPDPYDFANVLMDGSAIPATGGVNFAYFNNPVINAELAKDATLTGDARLKAYGATSFKIMHDFAPWATWNFAANLDLFGPKVACTVDSPAYGMDLGTMCLRSSG